jgi:transposase
MCEKANSGEAPVLIQTLLNRCHPLKRFVYRKAEFVRLQGEDRLVVSVEPRRNSKPICSCCDKPAPCYDHGNGEARLFQFVPLWGFLVYFSYCMRRVNCNRCGVKVERVPWAEGKTSQTKAYQLFLARWARRLSWKETADVFRTSWDSVFAAVRAVVDYGLRHRCLSGIEAIGVDEVQYRKGHNYMTLVYQIDEGSRRLLYIAEKRTVKSLLKFFRHVGPEVCSEIRFVCSDMWRPYLKVIRKKLPHALHILDRFHIVANLNKALNEVRAQEASVFQSCGAGQVLKHTKYCFLKNPENLTEKQKLKLSDILKLDIKSVRAYLLKEQFQHFWSYSSPYWAEWFLNKWCDRAMRSRLDPIKKFVRSIRQHQPLIMNYFKARKRFFAGVVEGLNRKVNLATRKAYGFRTFNALETALYHTMGDLPEPESTHEFF